MAYRWFAWKVGGYWRGNKLLQPAQISAVLKTLEDRHEVFASIQTYTEDEVIVECPLYADFDHKEGTLRGTQRDVQAFVFRVMDDFGVTPEIYFSGNKGFHVVLPQPIEGPDCHFVAREMAREYGGDLQTLDLNVYRPRAMWRLPGSPASRPGTYKTQLTKDELFTLTPDEITALATKKQVRKIRECDLGKLNEESFDDALKRARRKIPDFKPIPKEQLGRYETQFTHCLESLLTKEPAEGSRNKATFLLAKYFKQAGYSLEEATGAILSQPHYGEWNRTREVNVESVFKSVYKSPRPPIFGCRTGADAELMQAHCTKACPFNKDFPVLRFENDVI